MRKKSFEVYISPEERIDISLQTEKDKLKGFALNYRARIDGKWHQIYRIDNAHGYLHEQRYWLTPKPIALPTDEPVKVVFDRYYNFITQNYKRFRRYYLNSLK